MRQTNLRVAQVIYLTKTGEKMMTIKIERSLAPYIAGEVWDDITATCIQPIEMFLRGDKELDGATFSYYAASDNEDIALAGYRITYTDGDTVEETTWLGFEESAKLRPNVYKIQVTLAEVSKIAEGVLLSGFAVTQDEALSKTLASELPRLLDNAYASIRDSFGNEVPNMFALGLSADMLAVFQNTPCPEFKFNTQTTLWEALLEFGNCIGALPRVRFGSVTVSSLKESGNRFLVDFYYVTKSAGTVTEIGEGVNVVAAGKSLDKEQYNSNLTMVAENVIEE